MNQRSLIYAFVSRGTVILAEYTEFSGNFNSIAFQCLQKLPATNNKFTYNCDNHAFNYLVDNGYRFKEILPLIIWVDKVAQRPKGPREQKEEYKKTSPLP
ncbi:hypothetical protein S83_050205 [Arachis hypogaea]